MKIFFLLLLIAENLRLDFNRVISLVKKNNLHLRNNESAVFFYVLLSTPFQQFLDSQLKYGSNLFLRSYYS